MAEKLDVVEVNVNSIELLQKAKLAVVKDDKAKKEVSTDLSEIVKSITTLQSNLSDKVIASEKRVIERVINRLECAKTFFNKALTIYNSTLDAAKLKEMVIEEKRVRGAVRLANKKAKKEKK